MRKAINNRPLLFFYCISSLLITIQSACRSSANGNKINESVVTRRTITVETVFSGKILPYNIRTVYSTTKGHIVATKKTPGQLVRKGEPVVEIADQSGSIKIINADADGMVLNFFSNNGDAAQSSSLSQWPVFLLSDPVRKLVSADLDAISAQNIKEGQQLTIQVKDSVSLQGTIDYVNRLGTEINGNIRFHLSGKLNDSSNLVQLMGTMLPVHVVNEQQTNVLSIEKNAIVLKNGQSFVRVKQNNVVTLKPVVTGIADGNYIEIRSGIQENDKILLE